MEDLTIEQIITVFYNFLKAKGAFERYNNNRIAHFSTPKEKLYREGKSSWYKLITYAFSWSGSPEGHHYWLMLNKDWRSICPIYKQYLFEPNTSVNIF